MASGIPNCAMFALTGKEQKEKPKAMKFTAARIKGWTEREI